MRRFDYYKPKSLKELLKEKDENSLLLAGGTDLLVDIRSGKRKTEKVLDIKGIKDFYGIRKVKGGIVIGAGETFNRIGSSLLLKKFPALKEAALRMGCHEIRNRATIGGNICNSSPGCETGVVLMVYEAKLNIRSLRGKRTVPIADFIVGVNKTSLLPDEVLQLEYLFHF